MFSFNQDNRQRDVFPLPLINAPFPIECIHNSRNSRRRRNQKTHDVEVANEIVMSLNSLYGCSHVEASSELIGCQHAAHSHILQRATTHVAPALSLRKSPEEAYAALLGQSAVYGDGGPLKAYVKGLVSLPESVAGSQCVTSVLDSGDQEIWLDFCSRVMLSSQEYEEVLQEEGLAGLYTDPSLTNTQKVYGDFLKDLHKRGMIEFGRSAVIELGIFFVEKKNGKLRMIVDARRLNQRCKKPPSVSLASGDSLANLEIDPQSVLHLAQADVADCFHRMLLPQPLRCFFGLAGIEARYLGLTSLDGVPLGPTDRVVPRLCTLPMGFAWSLYFAQRAHEHVLQTGSSCFREELRLRDRKPQPDKVGDDPYHLQYVDNLGIFGTDMKRTNKVKDLGKSLMDKVGLVMNEHEDAVGEDQEILGHVVRPFPAEIRLKPVRAWKLRQAVKHLLKRRTVSGRFVEVLFGHFTYAFLLNRCMLSVFSSIYRFMRKAYVVAEPLWPSVRRELEIAVGLLPLAAVSLSREWSSDVWATDAAPHGLGACKSVWHHRSVCEIGRVAER